jgi:hypothetical protein
MLADYEETQFGREGFLKRYSRFYNDRRKNKSFDVENDQADYLTKF